MLSERIETLLQVYRDGLLTIRCPSGFRVVLTVNMAAS